MNRIIDIPGTQFAHEMRTSKQPVLLYFHASWSGGCRLLAPSLEKLARELEGDLSIRKTNLDDHPELARRYRITDVPTLILFDSGEPIARFFGEVSPQELKPCLQGLLGDYAPQKGIGRQL